ncbi:MAG: NADH-ubiquinone oxidoreductase-F iron-sulfur binding region domain-containing protein [Acidimicrobiales bacterium]
MTLVHRVLFPEAIESLEEYLARGGGVGLEAARGMAPDAIIEVIRASGLRGRGGAGFPTGVKWRTIVDHRPADAAASMVVNGAEGEPGTFKDRTILLRNPYVVLEGALIAARAVGADEILVALKQTFTAVVARVQGAIDEIIAAGLTEGCTLATFQGPNEYLYGEETALLETIDGRYPFPRIAPPWRRGDREVVGTAADAESGSGLSAHVELEGVPPTLVDNVETIANVARIVGRGADWFRTEGTAASPGSIVCTITGDVQHAGVGEVVMGTTLRDAIDLIGGGPRPGRRIKAALSGVANAVITERQLDTPLTYEDMAAVGSGLGSGGFIVFDDLADMASVAAGVSRFLAVESCGQCTPCKRDGVELSGRLARLSRSSSTTDDLDQIRSLASTVGDSARCFLATQHQTVVESILASFGDEVAAHASGVAVPVEPMLVAELLDISGDTAVWDEHHRDKQPDWTYDATDSGQLPAERYGEHRREPDLPQ